MDLRRVKEYVYYGQGGWAPFAEALNVGTSEIVPEAHENDKVGALALEAVLPRPPSPALLRTMPMPSGLMARMTWWASRPVAFRRRRINVSASTRIFSMERIGSFAMPAS